MLAKESWQDLIPHRGDMSLLHAVVDWNETGIGAIAISHRDTKNPLRDDGILRAVHLCEYGAQAMAGFFKVYDNIAPAGGPPQGQ